MRRVSLDKQLINMNLSQTLLKSFYIENGDKNFCFSPLSIIECLHNLEYCTDYKNLGEIISVIGDKDNLKSTIGRLKKSINSNNFFFYSNDFYKAIDRQVIEKIQSLETEIENFNNTSYLVERVNHLVDKYTNGKITNLISPKDVEGLTILFTVLNCVYFKKDWQWEFNDYNKTPKAFHGKSGDQLVPFLYKTADYKYFENDDYTIAELPYKQSSVSCYVVVPKGSDYLLTDKFDEIVNNCNYVKNDNTDVTLNIPTFKVESTFELKNALNNCGIKSIFEPTKDWSLIDWNKLLPEAVINITTARQKCYFDFTKEGSEAAAATVFMATISGCYVPFPKEKQKKEITVDKPFLYVLLDKSEMNIPLFVGSVKNID